MEFHPSLLKLCLWVLFVILQRHRCLGCADDERTALLEIKASARDPDDYPFSTWVADKTYCAWDRIQCSDTTGCVSQLDLSVGPYYDSLLNVSLFLPFEGLQHLDLSDNNINGTTGHQGFEKLAKLKRLRVLDLSGNEFSVSVLKPLSEVTSLRTLSLYGNDIGESSSSEKYQGVENLAKLRKLQALNLGGNEFNVSVLEPLSELTSLRTLYLDGNNLGESSSWEISQGFEKLAKLKKLRVLDLGNNHLHANVLEPLSELTSLKTLSLGMNYLGNSSASEVSQGFEKLSKLNRLLFLDLQDNNLKHTSILVWLSKLPSLQNLNLFQNQLRMGSSIEISQGFCELKKLQGIDLSDNNLNGEIPLCLVNFTSLRILDLSNNQLSGNIPPSLTANMTSLEWLDFSKNRFTGSVPLLSLFNSRSLMHMDFGGNRFQGAALMPSSLEQNFQLNYLDLSNCNLNTSTTNLFKFLHGQSELQYIDLSHNNIHGKFPNWLVANNTQLSDLILNNNSLSGDIHFPPHLRTNLGLVDLSKNLIEGHLQTNFGHVLEGVNVLNLSQNHLEGSIPASLGNIRILLALDLSNNDFTGEIPESLLGLGVPSLILSNNRLHGQVFLNSSEYNVVRLNNNQFTGIVVLPNNNRFTGIVPFRSSYLSTLDVSKNNISGRIPSWVANLTYVSTLVMGDNSFHGPIPSELCNLAGLEYLDLSQNELSGNIPSCFNLSSLTYMHLQGNKLSGSLPSAILRSPYLVTLNLNHNDFSGSIPGWLGLLENLHILLLNRNRLSGFVPHELCKSNKIWILDLSHNCFSGNIPPCLGNIAFGKFGGFPHNFEDPAGILLREHKYVHNIFGSRRADEARTYATQEEVEFMTKGLSRPYKGDILNYMSGMDLSCNNFTGHIPPEFGALTEIHALNLSHNRLTGPIPKTLSKLKQLESMDLSHNKLSGEIPSELTDLNFLGTFVVAYNNLSGRLPNMNQQAESSFEGNPYLCGPPLLKQCNSAAAPTDSATATDASSLSDVFGVDPISFLASCAGAYVVSLLALVIVLYINPYWRRLWFDSVDACLSFIFPFWSEAFYRVSNPFT